MRHGRAMTQRRIMIVEDDAMLAAILAELLDAMGHDVCAVEATAVGAAAAAAQMRPDLILADVLLAQGDGRAAMTAIAQDGAIPHIFMTGGAFTAEELPMGAPVLIKPFTDVELEGAIARAIGDPASG